MMWGGGSSSASGEAGRMGEDTELIRRTGAGGDRQVGHSSRRVCNDQREDE